MKTNGTGNTRWIARWTGLALTGWLAAGCGRLAEDTVTVGSKDFTEQFVMAEIMAQTIEGRTGLAVRRRTNLGGTMICHSALTRGDINLYAEYTGTALVSILDREEAIRDPDQVYDLVKDAYAREFNSVWLDPFGFNNVYTMTVREAFAQEHDLETIGDLAAIADRLDAGFTAEFSEREDGYAGLKRTYAFEFQSTRDMDPSLMYQAVAREQVDVISAFATDGRIAAYDLRLLQDDRAFFPPYYAAPVVRAETLERHPEVGEALAELAGLIDNETMQRLNKEVDEDGREPAVVAREFLLSHNLIQ